MLTPRVIRWAQCARLMKKNYGSAQPNLAQRWKNFALTTLSLRVHPDPINGELQAGDAIKNQSNVDEPRLQAA
jgi:hypothetical protein